MKRCYQLAALLAEGKALDRNVVAKTLGVGAATADRHIKAIRSQMKVFPTQRGALTVIRAERVGPKEPIPRSTTAAACIGASLHHLFQPTPVAAQMKLAMERLFQLSRDASEFSEYTRQFLFISRGGEKALQHHGSGRLDDVVDAIIKRKKIRLIHQRFNGTKETTYIHPFSLALHEHQLYLIGQVDGELKNIRFSRISSVATLKETFEYPSLEEYDPSKVFRHSLGIFIKDDPEAGIRVRKVKIRLDKRWLPYVQTHRWHHSQRHQVKDGAIILELFLRTCLELDRLILGFGPDAEVIAPDDLRHRLATKAKELSALYDAK